MRDRVLAAQSCKYTLIKKDYSNTSAPTAWSLRRYRPILKRDQICLGQDSELMGQDSPTTSSIVNVALKGSNPPGSISRRIVSKAT